MGIWFLNGKDEPIAVIEFIVRTLFLKIFFDLVFEWEIVFLFCEIFQDFLSFVILNLIKLRLMKLFKKEVRPQKSHFSMD